MKIVSRLLVILSITLLSSAAGLRAQDAPQPPPPDDQSQQGPPPGASDQGDPNGGDDGASFQTFYDQLGSQGQWVQTDDYGYVFQPNVTDPDWAPYTDGHWVYTDVGWTWVSDEPWGWATYHYGRWANIDGTGWVWVPGYRWAPAWVSWRYGGGYCGWAPLPPETFIGAEYGGGLGLGFHFGGDVDVNFNIGPGCYNFVHVGDMGEGNYRGHYLDRSRNYTVINNTTNITNININRNNGTGAGGNFRGVNVGGPTFAEVNAHSRQHVQQVQLTEANQAGRSSVQGNSLAVFAPRLNPASVHTARPAQVAQTIAHPTFNRGDSITKPLDVTSAVRPHAPSAQAIQDARTAESHVPAKAKIATEKTTIRTPLTKPLTSMQPVVPTHRADTATTPSFNNNTEHSTTTSPFTGEPATRPAVSQPNEVKPAPTFHPQTETAPSQTFHPQTEEKPAQTFHPQTEEKPAQTFHPQTEEKPAETFHPQTESHPAESFHPQTEVNHAPPPETHAQSAPAANHPSAPASHPAAPSGGGGKPAPASGNNQNH